MIEMVNNINKTTAISEKGEPIKGVGDTPNQHDMLTGSQPDGRAYTDGADIHEANTAYLTECLAVYRVLAAANCRSRWITIDCTGGTDAILPVAEVAAAIWHAVQPLVAATLTTHD